MGKASMSLLVATMLGFLVLCGPAWAVEPNLVSHWKFDEGSGTTAYDSAGSNNGTIYGATWTTGQVNGALDFDGVDDYVDCGTGPAITGTGTFTASVWVKTDSAKGQAMLVQRSTTSGNGSYGVSILSDGRVQLHIYNGGYGFLFQSDVTVNDGLWHHIVAARTNSTDGEIYVDGSLAASGSGPARSLSNFPVWIGRGFTVPAYFNGLIDEVRIYNRALSAEEIRQLYLDGLSEYERAVICVENAIDKKQAALEAVDAALVEEADAYDALEELLESGDYGDLKKGDIVKAKQKVHSAIRNEERSLDALEKSIEKLYDALAALGWEPEPEPNLIAHWKFDEGSGTIAYDSVGGNVGTIYGDAEWTTGQFDGALSFDGVDDYVDCGNTFASVTGSATKSIMAWVKSATTDYSTPDGMILELYRRSDSSSGFYVSVRDNPATWHSFHRNSGSYTLLDSEVNVTNEWTHIALVQDGSNVNLYINGVAEVSASDGVAPSISSPPNASIGAYIHPSSTAGAYFNGSIDDVRIYDRVLSAEEIQELYLDGLSKSGKGKGK